VTIDPHFERSVLAELRLRERRARRRDELHGARLLAQKLHHGQLDLLAHLRRVAHGLPGRFRAVAWLHHAHEADLTPRALTAVGLTKDEAAAVELFDAPSAPRRSVLQQARSLSNAPGRPGQLARVVTRAAIEDRLDGAPPSGETLSALRLLPDPRLTA
jgi:hypothetical protein